MGYHSEGIGNNKRIRKERLKPIPLMKWKPEDIKEPSELNEKINRYWPRKLRDRKNIIDC